MFSKKILAAFLLGSVCAVSAVPAAHAAQTQPGVTVKKVNFKNNNTKMVGNMYLLANFAKDKKYPAISVAHPWGGVKEQTAGIYARKLAEKGFIALAYDASHYGESGGEPRIVKLLPTSTPPADAPQFVRNAYDYYNTPRGRHPNATGNFYYTSTLRQLEFYPFAQIRLLSPRPLFLISGREAQTLYFSQQATSWLRSPRSCILSTALPTSTCTTRRNSLLRPSGVWRSSLRII